LSEVDLASEMAAARKRLSERTAKAIRDSRVLAIRVAVRPGSSRTEIEELARSFYPRLSQELLDEATNIVCEMQRGHNSNSTAASASVAASDVVARDSVADESVASDAVASNGAESPPVAQPVVEQ
jgi:hypothetical protein